MKSGKGDGPGLDMSSGKREPVTVLLLWGGLQKEDGTGEDQRRRGEGWWRRRETALVGQPGQQHAR